MKKMLFLSSPEWDMTPASRKATPPFSPRINKVVEAGINVVTFTSLSCNRPLPPSRIGFFLVPR